jgi:hypothetical protein
MRVLGASGVQQSAAQRANAGAARRHESAAADGIQVGAREPEMGPHPHAMDSRPAPAQVDEDHGPPKRARLGDDGLTPAQLQDEIAPSLERWSEAVRSSADLMDGYGPCSCSLSIFVVAFAPQTRPEDRRREKSS